MQKEVEVIVENGFLNTSNMKTLILSVHLLKGNLVEGGTLVIDDKNKIKILETEKAMEFEDGKILYHLFIKGEDAENLIGVKLWQIYKKNVCKIVYND